MFDFFVEEVELPIDSDDQVVWRFAQSNDMILLTANRSMKRKNSLEQVMRGESTHKSRPVITIGNVDRLITEADYRESCVNRLSLVPFLQNGFTTKTDHFPTICVGWFIKTHRQF